MDITAKRIKELRKSRRMSQDELARLVGYSGRSTICTIERNSMEMSVDKLTKIANVFNVPVSYLLGMDEVKTKEQELCTYFKALNEEGQQKLLDFARIIAEVPELARK